MQRWWKTAMTSKEERKAADDEYQHELNRISAAESTHYRALRELRAQRAAAHDKLIERLS